MCFFQEMDWNSGYFYFGSSSVALIMWIVVATELLLRIEAIELLSGNSFLKAETVELLLHNGQCVDA